MKSAVKSNIAIQDNKTIVFTISYMKKSYNKTGIMGWILFRKYNMAEFENTNLNGNEKTSAIAKKWKNLTQEEKEWWKSKALNADTCGNRWAAMVLA